MSNVLCAFCICKSDMYDKSLQMMTGRTLRIYYCKDLAHMQSKTRLFEGRLCLKMYNLNLGSANQENKIKSWRKLSQYQRRPVMPHELYVYPFGWCECLNCSIMLSIAFFSIHGNFLTYWCFWYSAEFSRDPHFRFLTRPFVHLSPLQYTVL